MRRIHFSRPLKTSMTAAALVGLPMVALGLKLGLPALMVAAMVAGIGSTMSSIAWNTSLQQGVPKDKMSRVMAFDDFGSFVGIPVGLVLAMPVADQWGLTTVETIGGLVWMILAVLPLTWHGVRQMTTADIQARGMDSEDALPG